MKTFICLFSLIVLLVTTGRVVAPPIPAGVSVGVYGDTRTFITVIAATIITITALTSIIITRVIGIEAPITGTDYSPVRRM
jgi:hypothetical protein